MNVMVFSSLRSLYKESAETYKNYNELQRSFTIKINIFLKTLLLSKQRTTYRFSLLKLTILTISSQKHRTNKIICPTIVLYVHFQTISFGYTTTVPVPEGDSIVSMQPCPWLLSVSLLSR